VANNVWLDVDGDWENVANWSLAHAPISTEIAFITDGTQDIDTNLAQSAVTLADLRMGPGFRGTLGASGNPLEINGANFDFESGGPSCWVDGTWSGNVIVRGGTNSDDLLQLDGDIGTLKVLGGLGTVTVAANSVLDFVDMHGAPNAKLVLNDNITSLDDVEISSGKATIYAAITGTLTARSTGNVIIDGSNTVAAIVMEPGGVVRYDSSGTLTTLTGWSGFFNGTRNANSLVQITNCETHEGFTLDLRSGLNNWTLPNGIIYNGGNVRPPIGSTLTIT
jgi:hypothetical protein